MTTPYTVHHHQPVWETATITVEVPDDIPVADHEQWITDHFTDLLSEALNNDRAVITQGDVVEGIDSDLDIVGEFAASVERTTP